MLKLQAAVLGSTLAVSLVASLAIGAIAGEHGRRSIAFAVPAVVDAKPRWSDETARFASQVSRAFGLDHGLASEFSVWILEASKRQKLEPELLASLVFTESSFRKHVRSHVGAIGPAQVRPKFWRSFCGTDLKDPAENIYCGAQILSYYRDVCGGNRCALKSYNIGYYNLDSAYYVEAGQRYLSKVDRHRQWLMNAVL